MVHLDGDIVDQLHAVLNVNVVLCGHLAYLEQDWPDVLDLTHLYQEWDVVEEFSVIHVVVPRDDGQGILRLEEVGDGGVVDDDNVFHTTVQLGQVFDIILLLVKSAVLSE